MNPMLRTLPMLLAALALEACASTPEPPPQTATERTRHRRRRRTDAAPDVAVAPAGSPAIVQADAAPTVASPAPQAGAPTTDLANSGALSLPPTVRRVDPAPGNAPSIGSPVVAQRASGSLTPRWIGSRGAARIVCEGEASRQRPSMQSPYDPTNAMIVRAFVPVERSVLACNPPLDAEGRVPVRVVFGSGGLPEEVSLGSDVSRTLGLCLGAAICTARITAFRAPNATVTYSFVGAVTAPAGNPEAN